MDNATVFYVLGAVLAVSAVIVTFLGLRLEKFPGRAAPVVFLCFAILVGGATTFAVRNGKEEQEAKARELEKAGEEIEAEEAPPVEAPGGKSQEGRGGEAKAKSGGTAGSSGGTLKLAADPAQIAFDTTALTGKPGKVTIDFNNPATLEHNVAIEQDGKQLAISETIVDGKTSVTADLKPGTYTFLCTVPGHAEAGMEGTLTIE